MCDLVLNCCVCWKLGWNSKENFQLRKEKASKDSKREEKKSETQRDDVKLTNWKRDPAVIVLLRCVNLKCKCISFHKFVWKSHLKSVENEAKWVF